MKKIIQIIPAGEWTAKFKLEDGSTLKENLTCFALMEDDDDTYVVGMCGDEYIDFCDSARNFTGYEKRKAAVTKVASSTRTKVLQLANSGFKPKEICEQLGIDKSTVSRYLKKTL